MQQTLEVNPQQQQSSTVITTEQEPLLVPDIQTIETPYDVIKRNREILAQELRDNVERQIYGKASDGNGKFCFIGLGHHIAAKHNLENTM